jgi:hypothetical protein
MGEGAPVRWVNKMTRTVSPSSWQLSSAC